MSVQHPPISTDAHGNRYAAVHVEELDEWAWMLGQLEDWLLHASAETVEDWAEFTGPCGTRIENVIYVLGHWSVRMRNLAEGRSPRLQPGGDGVAPPSFGGRSPEEDR